MAKPAAKTASRAVLGASLCWLIGGSFAGLASETPYHPNDCVLLDLRDESGNRLRGVEDMAAVAGAGWVLLSAYDRRSELDAKRSPHGLFGLSLADLNTEGRLTVSALSASFGASQPFFPHGIGILERADGEATVAVVNRRRNGQPGDGTTIELFTLRDRLLDHRHTIERPELCRANDVVPLGEETVAVTLDGQACGGLARALELAFAAERGRVVRVGTGSSGGGIPIELAKELAFPNGIARMGDRLMIAVTREARVIDVAPTVYGEAPLHNIHGQSLPGGPDNLTLTPEGLVLTAIHDRLMGLALYRLVGQRFGFAGTHIVAIDPNDGLLKTVFHDPKGELFAAGTVALETARGLLVGSAINTGLLWCPHRASPAPP
ncbi:MAG: hypothetical protein ACFB6S_00875 [Geminicoccaceae bacterium]